MGTGSFSEVKCGRGVLLTTHPLLVPRSRKSKTIPLHPTWATPGLYTATVPVQYSCTSTTPIGRTACKDPQCLYSKVITLLPLLAVVPVQSLSVCTVQLYLYFPYGPYGLYRASVPVQYSYTSTPPMGRKACTEPQCLYKGALLPFYLLPSNRTWDIWSSFYIRVWIKVFISTIGHLCSWDSVVALKYPNRSRNFSAYMTLLCVLIWTVRASYFQYS